MFIAQAFKSYHDWWRYLVGIIVVFVAAQIGSIPFLVAVGYKSMQDGGGLSDLADMSKLMTILDPNLTLFLVLLSFVAGFVALLFMIRYLHNQPLIEATTSRPKIDWKRFFVGFGLVAVTTITFVIIDYKLNPDDYVLQFQLWPFLILALIVILLMPLQTSMEEYVFRGYLMQGIGVLAKNRWLPLILTSVTFGLLHLSNPEVGKLGNIIMVYYIGTGFLLGIMTLMDEGLELALGFHAGNNIVAALLVTADWTVFQTNSILKDVSEPSAGLDIVLPVLILYPIYLIILAKLYKWTDWKEKLFGRVEKPIVVAEEPKNDLIDLK
jgi:membrane protease YdiL (CAAX protease family)